MKIKELLLSYSAHGFYKYWAHIKSTVLLVYIHIIKDLK